ncbi:MAG: hypothetical protein KF774_12085 [Planctomyces sp.]|nr:hypothetical protein [Planctomyces sp.]
MGEGNSRSGRTSNRRPLSGDAAMAVVAGIALIAWGSVWMADSLWFLTYAERSLADVVNSSEEWPDGPRTMASYRARGAPKRTDLPWHALGSADGIQVLMDPRDPANLRFGSAASLLFLPAVVLMLGGALFAIGVHRRHRRGKWFRPDPDERDPRYVVRLPSWLR